MADVIYRVTYADGSMCHTAHKPLADVWAKRQGSKLEEIQLKNPTRLRVVNSGDSMADRYERAFTGANRTAATWAAFQAGWNAAKPSDQAIIDSIASHYHRDVWERRKAKEWAERDLTACRCDHNEYCGKCFPVEFREGGEFYEWTGEPSRNPMANQAETSGSPIKHGKTYGTENHTCPRCDAKPGQEHAQACPRHPSDPMGVRRNAGVATGVPAVKLTVRQIHQIAQQIAGTDELSGDAILDFAERLLAAAGVAIPVKGQKNG
jgi:hypothetical protein